ncbi:MAG TPA: dihydropyrimidinase [Candidatus Methylomirabilis sp.]|nr:dihydropyrimidinase [Candidatus Methylomirabilis sp.]
MQDFDLTIRHGTVVTAVDTFQCDIGITSGRIVAMCEHLPAGGRDIDASGRLVLPGGVDSHCHVEQLSSMGMMGADDFYSATVSAACGGTTTIIPFAAQHRGHSIQQTVDDYAERARTKAVIDYGFHLIISDPNPDVLGRELPEYIRRGITSVKVYTTYDRLRLDDAQVLDVLALADREGALVMVHAENHEMIRWITTQLLGRGDTAPRFHATSHSPLAESEATNRAIQLARLLEVPLLIVHVSTTEAVRAIRTAQTLGVRIYAETCPQYLILTAADIDRPGLEGAKFCCSPPPRDEESQGALWGGLANGTIQLVSSDHSPYRFDASGKLPKGEKTTFKDMANGVPGIEVRLPLLFSEGVLRGRMTLNEFVALTATNHAKMYGLHPRKGTLAIGSDGDVAIWDPEKEVPIRATALHDNVGYTPYEGRVLKGWPETVLSRGRIVVSGGVLQVEGGSGVFLPCGRPGPIGWDRKPSPESQWFHR